MTNTKRFDKIGPQEVGIMVAFASFSRLLWLNRNTFYDKPGQSVWISVLIGGAVAIVVALAAMYFVRQRDFTENIQYAYGKKLGTVVMLFFVLYCMLMFSARASRIQDEMAAYIYTGTSKTTLRIVFSLVIMFIACCGPAAVSRTIKFGTLVVVGTLVIMFAFALARNTMKMSRMFPIFGEGMVTTLLEGIEYTGSFWPVFAILPLTTHTGHSKKTSRAVVVGIIAAAGVLAITMVVMSASISAQAYQGAISPLLYFASIIHTGEFLHRVDSLFICGWITLALLTSAFALQSGAHMLAQMSGAKTVKPFCVGLAGLEISLSTLFSYSITATELVSWLWVPALVLVALGSLLEWIRRKHEKTQ